jgi:hypothetical protein
MFETSRTWSGKLSQSAKLEDLLERKLQQALKLVMALKARTIGGRGLVKW